MGRDVGLTLFHLVRHARHGLLGRVLTGRMPGVGLSDAGRAEAGRLADCFAGRAVVAVVSSPLERAQQTAGPIADRHGLSVTTEPGFDEIDFGVWSGLGFAELDLQPEWQAWNARRSLARCPGGETMLQAQARAVAALLALRTAYREGEVVVVSHQDVVRSVAAHVLGAPLDLFARLALDPAHRIELALTDDGALVHGVNLPPPPL